MLRALAFVAMLFAFLGTVSSFAAPDSSQRPDNGEAPGFGFGSLGFESAGFIFRQYFGRFGISGGFGGYWNYGYGKIGVASTFLRSLKHLHFSPRTLPNSSLRINLPVGVSFALRHGYGDTDNKRVNTFIPSVSIGLGVEYFFNENVALHLETPWTTSLEIRNRTARVSINFVPNGGLVFYF